MFIKKDKSEKSGFCIGCVIKIMAIVSFIVLSIMLFLRLGDIKANANEYTTQYYESTEVRKRTLELLAEGKFDYGDKEYAIEQTTNQRMFRVQSIRTRDEFEIIIIPNINEAYEFPSQGAWSILFDEHDDIDSIQYYIQGNSDGTNNVRHDNVSIIVKPYNNSIQVSTLLGKNYLYEDILIPLSIRNFFLMPIQQFFGYTNQLLYWDWVLPQMKYADINERSRNLANYLSQNLRMEETRMENLFNDAYLQFSELEKNELLTKRRAVETHYIKSNIDWIMKYIGTDLVDETMFNPYDVNRQVIPNFHETYLQVYIKNVVSFLQEFPDFYTPVKVLETPFTQENFRELYLLYNELYTMTIQNPGLIYIVPVRKTIKEGELTSDTIITMEVLIPYFTLNGVFKVYGWNVIQSYLKDEYDEKKVRSIKYFFDEVGMLRVPNKKVYRSLGQ